MNVLWMSTNPYLIVAAGLIKPDLFYRNEDSIKRFQTLLKLWNKHGTIELLDYGRNKRDNIQKVRK